MPSFLVYRLGQPMRRLTFETPPIRVGRDPENDIVIRSETLSREHAMFLQDESKRWYVTCVSETNPIVVGGKLVAKSAPVADMSEILVGNECLIIFVTNPANAAHLVDSKSTQQVVCPQCWWTAMMSIYNNHANCPRCGGGPLAPAEEPLPGTEEGAAPLDASTRMMSGVELRSSYRIMREAKRSVLLRTDQYGGRKFLSESESVEITKDHPEMPLKGMFVGGGFTLAWDGQSWTIENHLSWRRLFVNGQSVNTTQLKIGDVIEVGANRFQLTSE